MRRLVNRYVRRHVRIVGKHVWCDKINMTTLERDVMDVFCIRFNFHDWCSANVGETFCIHFTPDDGTEYTWYRGRQEHREDGPAEKMRDGRVSYYFDGSYCHGKAEFNDMLKVYEGID